MSKKIILAFAVLAAMLLLPLFAARAAPPEIYMFPLDDHGDFPCGDFSVRDEWTGELRVVIHSWDPIHITAHYRTMDYFYRIDLEGNQVGEKYPVHINWVTVINKNGWMDLGAITHAVVPGQGSVYLDAGRMFTDIEGNVSYQGHHQFEGMGLERLCAAFE